MIAKEGSGARLIDLAGCHHQYKLDNIFLFGLDAEAIEIKKKVGCGKTRPLVSINKRMVLDDPEQIGSSEIAKIGLTIGLLLQRPCQRRFQHPLITNTGGTSVKTQLLRMHRLNEFPRVEFGHLARAR